LLSFGKQFGTLKLLDALFPFTPALSVGERENRLPSWFQEGVLEWNKRGQMVLPLLGERADVRGTAMNEFPKVGWIANSTFSVSQMRSSRVPG
jgi:hypothetical protein